MLAIDYFVRGTMHQYALPVKDKIDNIPTLPLPLRDFASRLTDSIYVRRDTTIASNQLKSIIAGSYKATKRRGEYQYQPAGLEKPIPLASTSSLVTELAGFALILGQLSYTTGFIVFEEPEAHLHLDAQREMAKILVGLANQGRHLIITTHSDTFLQQINNLIALNDHPDAIALRSKLNIPEEYTINRENVAAYDFICNDGVTVAKKLECTNTGFIATSLNEILLKIAQETYEINSGWNQN